MIDLMSSLVGIISLIDTADDIAVPGRLCTVKNYTGSVWL
jgi:hypothetical protein